MALSYAEAFVRAYAEKKMKAIEIAIDKQTGMTRLSFYGREQRVNMRDLVLQEDAFRRLGIAVDALLGIPEQAEPAGPIDLQQLKPEPTP